jgi:hypothetical protein
MVSMGVTLYPNIYTMWIFVVTFLKYRSIYEIYHPVVGTILVAIGPTLYPSIYMTWFIH